MPIGGGLLGLGAGIWGTSQAASKYGQASSQAEGLMEGLRGDMAPYLKAGQGALANMQNPNAFMKSPGYQFRLDQGINGVNTDKAVNGLLRSGGALKAVDSYNQNFASNEFNNWWQQQSGLAGMGLQSEGITANAMTNEGNLMTGNAAVQGNADINYANMFSKFAGNVLGGVQGQYGGGSSYGS